MRALRTAGSSAMPAARRRRRHDVTLAGAPAWTPERTGTEHSERRARVRPTDSPSPAAASKVKLQLLSFVPHSAFVSPPSTLPFVFRYTPPPPTHPSTHACLYIHYS